MYFNLYLQKFWNQKKLWLAFASTIKTIPELLVDTPMQFYQALYCLSSTLRKLSKLGIKFYHSKMGLSTFHFLELSIINFRDIKIIWSWLANRIELGQTVWIYSFGQILFWSVIVNSNHFWLEQGKNQTIGVLFLQRFFEEKIIKRHIKYMYIVCYSLKFSF